MIGGGIQANNQGYPRDIGVGMKGDMRNSEIPPNEYIEHRDANLQNKPHLGKSTPADLGTTHGRGGLVADLTLEEGAILIENWKKSNFSEFNDWLLNACAQATFNTEEKFSMDNKSKKSKPVQMKSFQCHLKVEFMDSSLETLIANGFGRNKKDAKKMAMQQMVTFLVQKKLIKYGLVNKMFLENRTANRSFSKDKVESRLLAPEEEKKNKELRTILEDIQTSLAEDKFDDACMHFAKIKKLKNHEWFEVCGLWTYIVKKRNIKYVKFVLELITGKPIRLPEELSSATINKTRNKLQGTYGHSRMRVLNPYELYDHRGVAAEILGHSQFSHQSGLGANTPLSNPASMQMENSNGSASDLVFRPAEGEALKSLMVGHRLSGRPGLTNPDTPGRSLGPIGSAPGGFGHTPEPLPERTVQDLDVSPYKPVLDKTEVKEVKMADINYINMSLLSDMYDLLMFSGDVRFSSIAAEIIYSCSRLDDTGFVNWCAAHYFSNRRNMIFHEMLEANYNKFLMSGAEFSKLEGKVEIVGRSSKQEVVMFSPKGDDIPQKVLRKGSSSHAAPSKMFREGEFVLLVSKRAVNGLGSSSANPLPGSIQTSAKENAFGMVPERLDDFQERRNLTTLEQIAKNPEVLKRIGLIAPTASDGNYLSSTSNMSFVMAYVSEISHNHLLKLLVLFEDGHLKALESPDTQWHLVKSSIPVPNYPRVCESLKTFSVKICMNPVLQQVLLATPLSNINCLSKLIKAPGLQINPGTNELIKNILTSVEEKFNIPQSESIKSAICQTMTVVQSPPGTNKLAAIVEILKAWCTIGSGHILICSRNKSGLEQIHMALLNSNISSLYLNDEAPTPEANEGDIPKVLEWAFQNKHSLNPNTLKVEVFKVVVDQYRVVCSPTSELISDSLKSMT